VTVATQSKLGNGPLAPKKTPVTQRFIPLHDAELGVIDDTTEQ
jgi:hypothetical protein